MKVDIGLHRNMVSAGMKVRQTTVLVERVIYGFGNRSLEGMDWAGLAFV
jgi:hypothetical protein